MAFFFLLLVLLAGGVWFYTSQSEEIRAERNEQLANIGRLKVRWILDWRKNCLMQVGKQAGNPFFVEPVQQFLQAPGSPEARSRVLEMLEYERKYTRCEAMEIRARDGRLLLSAGPVEDSSGEEEMVAEALKAGEPVLSSLVRNPAGHIHITAAAPVPGTDGHPVAVLTIRTDPGQALYPLVTEWPGASATAETLLVERQGDEVVFLNDLRYRPDAALSLRIALSRTNIPSVQAVLGVTGQFLGTDYRGVKVVSDLRPVPDSPWFMVAKVDSAEAYADLNAMMEVIIVLIFCFATAIAALLYALYRGGQVRLLRRLDEEHAANEENLRRLNAELEERVERRTEQLASSNRELEAFAYSVSHDLRAPLRAIEGFSSILVEEYGQKLDDEARRLLGVVRSSTEKMDRLIHGILELSRIVRAQIEPADLDMAELARSAWEEVVPAAERWNYEFVLSALPHARGDALLLRQVWVNLLSNAAKYSGRSEVRRIEVGATPGEGETCYFVKDSGAGFDPAYASKLFGLFQRLHKDSEFEGLGIGLANVQRIVRRHGGEIRAEGSLGNGATFFFTLPKTPENL